MPKIPLRVIPEPELGTRTVLVSDAPGTVHIKGQATGHDYVCGACGAVLLEGVERGQVEDIVFQCTTCGAFNDMTTMHA